MESVSSCLCPASSLPPSLSTFPPPCYHPPPFGMDFEQWTNVSFGLSVPALTAFLCSGLSYFGGPDENSNNSSS